MRHAVDHALCRLRTLHGGNDDYVVTLGRKAQQRLPHAARCAVDEDAGLRSRGIAHARSLKATLRCDKREAGRDVANRPRTCRGLFACSVDAYW